MHEPLPEPYASFTNVDLLRRIAFESDVAKQLLREAGFGVTGMSLPDTVRHALHFVEMQRVALGGKAS